MWGFRRRALIRMEASTWRSLLRGWIVVAMVGASQCFLTGRCINRSPCCDSSCVLRRSRSRVLERWHTCCRDSLLQVVGYLRSRKAAGDGRRTHTSWIQRRPELNRCGQPSDCSPRPCCFDYPQPRFGRDPTFDRWSPPLSRQQGMAFLVRKSAAKRLDIRQSL